VRSRRSRPFSLGSSFGRSVRFFGFVALRAIVCAFALIGVLSVVRTKGSVAAEPPAPILAARSDTSVIPGLPEYPGARRSEFRAEIFGDELVTEIEYVVDSGVPEVRDHYRDAFVLGDWTVTDTAWLYGEWIYSVSRGKHHGAVEIEHRNGVTEVEVEMAEPAWEPPTPR
jgi:hypothetical protein